MHARTSHGILQECFTEPLDILAATSKDSLPQKGVHLRVIEKGGDFRRMLSIRATLRISWIRPVHNECIRSGLGARLRAPVATKRGHTWTRRAHARASRVKPSV